MFTAYKIFYRDTFTKNVLKSTATMTTKYENLNEICNDRQKK